MEIICGRADHLLMGVEAGCPVLRCGAHTSGNCLRQRQDHLGARSEISASKPAKVRQVWERRQRELYFVVHEMLKQDKISYHRLLLEMIVSGVSALCLVLSRAADEFPHHVEFPPVYFSWMIRALIRISFVSSNEIGHMYFPDVQLESDCEKTEETYNAGIQAPFVTLSAMR